MARTARRQLEGRHLLFLKQVKAWVERLKSPPTENAMTLFNEAEGFK